jgi:hypothetical protein
MFSCFTSSFCNAATHVLPIPCFLTRCIRHRPTRKAREKIFKERFVPSLRCVPGRQSPYPPSPNSSFKLNPCRLRNRFISLHGDRYLFKAVASNPLDTNNICLQRRDAIVQGADAIMQISNDAAKEFDKAVLAVMLKVRRRI